MAVIYYNPTLKIKACSGSPINKKFNKGYLAVLCVYAFKKQRVQNFLFFKPKMKRKEKVTNVNKGF